MNKIECLRILERMAVQSQGQIFDEYEIDHYVESLEHFGWDRVFDALRQLRKSSRKLPTIAEIESAMGIAAPVSAETAISGKLRNVSGLLATQIRPAHERESAK